MRGFRYENRNMRQPGLIVILGATATGKTNLAIQLAKHLNAPILSADSRQVYRHLDIGTAKPSLLEQQGVPHYLIDIVDLEQNFTVAEYQQQAQALIANFHAQGVTPILVGGTGLYIRAITRGMQIPKVPPQIELRSQLEELGQAYCYKALQQVDSQVAIKIHINDRVRTIRALEVFYTTGIPLSAQQGELPPSYPICQIGVNAPSLPIHRQWISDRVEKMLEAGWLDEISQLLQKHKANLPLLRTLGYAEMTDYLLGKITLDAAKELTVTHTCQFAKRQRTWFSNSHTPDMQWSNGNPSTLLDLIHDFEDRQVHTN